MAPEEHITSTRSSRGGRRTLGHNGNLHFYSSAAGEVNLTQLIGGMFDLQAMNRMAQLVAEVIGW